MFRAFCKLSSVKQQARSGFLREEVFDRDVISRYGGRFFPDFRTKARLRGLFFSWRVVYFSRLYTVKKRAATPRRRTTP